MFTVVRHQAAGRKLKPGKWIIDQKTGKSGIFVGYCDGCEAKHFLPKDAMVGMLRYIGSDNAALRTRLLKMLLKDRIA